MRVKGLFLGVTLLSLIALAACSGSEESEAEVRYLNEIGAIDARMGDALDSIGDALNTTWPTRSRLIEVLEEMDILAILATQGQEANQVSPPVRFRSDHERYLQFLNEATPIARDHQRAVDNEDVLAIFMGRARFLLNRNRMLDASSPAFCQGLAPPDAPPDEVAVNCGGAEGLPGGVYGDQLHDIMRRYSSEFGPRVSSFPPMFTPDELFESLAILNIEIEDTIEEALEGVRGLRPSASFRQDHEVVVLYLRDNLELARAITQAARERDNRKLLDDYFPESGVVLCTAQQNLSEDFRPIVSVFFGQEAPEFCN